MGRCLLLESGLPKTFWTYAVMAAVYIRNRCFNQRTHETPYYLLTKRRPDVSKLHVFGTICYPYIEEYKNNLDPRSSEGIFVGYDKNSPAYLVYYPNSNTTRRHRTVKFTDKFKNAHDKQIPNNNISDEFEDDTALQNEFNEIETQKDDKHIGKESDDDINNQSKNSNINNSEGEQKDVSGKSVDVRKLPSRSRNPPKHLNDYACSNIDFCYRVMNVPKTYKEAFETSDTDEWKKAMNNEIDSLIENNTFDVITLPVNKNPVMGRWVYSIKSDPGGKTMHKARFVAKGYSQVLGSDYFNTFSPTAKMTTIRMMMQISDSPPTRCRDRIFECSNRL